MGRPAAPANGAAPKASEAASVNAKPLLTVFLIIISSFPGLINAPVFS